MSNALFSFNKSYTKFVLFSLDGGLDKTLLRSKAYTYFIKVTTFSDETYYVSNKVMAVFSTLFNLL